MIRNEHKAPIGHIQRALAVTVALLVSVGVMPLLAQNSVTDEELASFADALNSVQAIQQQMVSDSQASVAGSELGEQRFQELFQAEQAGTDPEALPSESEQAEFDRVLQELQQIQQDSNQQMAEAVREEGLQVDRFNQIAQAVQQDQSLMQRLQDIAGDGQS